MLRVMKCDLCDGRLFQGREDENVGRLETARGAFYVEICDPCLDALSRKKADAERTHASHRR